MEKSYVMGIDEGTTSARTLIFDGEGQIVAETARELTQKYPHPGWVEHDPTEIIEAQLETMRHTLEKAGVSPQDIRTIGLTNQRETAMVWEKESGRPIYNAIVWASRQSADVVERWAAAGLGEEVRKKTGLIMDAYYSASKIAWILDRVEGARGRAERGELLAGTIDAWLMWNLTGRERFVTDYSNAARTMMFNIHELRWDEELCKGFDIPISILPEVLPSDAHFGTVGQVFGAEVPIQGVLGDQQAGLFGQACYEKGLAKMTFGTAGVFVLNTGSEPVVLDGLTASTAWGVNGEVTYEIEGVIYASGKTMQWLRDDLKIIHSAPDSEWYSGQVPDTQGVYLVPAFTGLAAPEWDMYARAAIVGMSSSTNRLHIIRAGLESMAYQTRDVVDRLLASGEVGLSELRVDGGAAKNSILCQFQADILGIPVIRPKNTEATVTGAAYLAGLSSGLWKDLDEVASLWQEERVFEPRMSEERREQIYAGWREAVKLTRGWAKKVVVAE
jgi:glycerol kinase